VPSSHALAQQASVTAEQLKSETMLLLGNGHCFRDHVLEVCPEFARFSSDAEGIRKSFEGSVAGDHQAHGGRRHGHYLGATAERSQGGTGAQKAGARRKLREVPAVLDTRSDGSSLPPPTRRVVLAWRRSFTRYEAIAALRNAIYSCELPGVGRLVLDFE